MRALFLLLLSGCGATSSEVANALTMTAVALTASAISVSQGGCVASCPVGTTCNSATSFCDPLPCRGMCRIQETCVNDRCELRGSAPSLASGKRQEPASQPSPTLW